MTIAKACALNVAMRDSLAAHETISLFVGETGRWETADGQVFDVPGAANHGGDECRPGCTGCLVETLSRRRSRAAAKRARLKDQPSLFAFTLSGFALGRGESETPRSTSRQSKYQSVT
ncbi:hypothetical protein FJ987_09540 [Mesorhizobium sp. CU2]|uniref:hypothetical protein n=1 Tax=unclassified Mesorhizobium TaxID=325217 RepID=UPI00112DD24F|nr:MULTISPECIES: hypothetical protein [unclassified Mesorhizobium]TPN86398.1 hypothetical protein FJ988_06305 [Mesorhizobium sp. CU3]TPO17177.1 hypothetical protein FJ987_09540 [Mesorhizobium sp. CU2]